MSQGYTINHVGLAVPHIADYLTTHRQLYVDFVQTQVVVNEAQQVREVFLTDWHTTIELLEPTGPSSPLAGFLQKNELGGLVHICFNCNSVDDAIKDLRNDGGRLISGPTPDVAFDNRPVAFVFLGGQVVELVQRP